MAEEQLKRLFVTPHLMQLQRKLACQRGIRRIVGNLLLQLLLLLLVLQLVLLPQKKKLLST